MEQFKKLLEKKMKKGEVMDDSKKAAKLAALKALHDDMKGMMGGGLHDHLENLKKVTVAAPDKEHLKKGLEAARGMVSSLPENEDEDEKENNSMPESEPQDEEVEQEEEEGPEPSEESPQHEEDERREIEDLKREIEELKQLVLRSR